MSEVSDRFRRAAEGFTATVEALPSERWSSPSPCEGWSARDVADHVIDASRSFFDRAGVDLPPAAGDDPAARWRTTRDAVQAALDDPVVAGREYDGSMGKTTLEATVDRFLVGDVLIHTWDLAQAAGLEARLDEGLLTRYHEMMSQMGDMPRQNGVFGPALEPPADADVQTKVLAFTGRQAWHGF